MNMFEVSGTKEQGREAVGIQKSWFLSDGKVLRDEGCGVKCLLWSCGPLSFLSLSGLGMSRRIRNTRDSHSQNPSWWMDGRSVPTTQCKMTVIERFGDGSTVLLVHTVRIDRLTAAHRDRDRCSTPASKSHV